MTYLIAEADGRVAFHADRGVAPTGFLPKRMRRAFSSRVADVHVQDLMLMTGRQLLSPRGLALGVRDATAGRHECCILVWSGTVWRRLVQRTGRDVDGSCTWRFRDSYVDR